MNTKKIHAGNLTAEAGKVYDFKMVTGWLDAQKADDNAFPKLTSIGGYADFQGWTGSAPKLTSIGGYAYFKCWTGSAPKLTSIGGYADFRGWTGSAPKLTSIGGYAYFRGWTGSAPKLTSIGGYADFQGWTGDLSKIKTNDPAAREICRKATFNAFRKQGFHFADGILAKIVASKGRVSRVVIVGKSEVSYVVEVGDGIYSHGATLKDARESLIYKIGSRDTTPYKSWTLETKKPLGEMIGAYRAITGACEQGVRNFVESNGVSFKSLTVADAIALTAGSYGAEQFKKFFEGNK